MVGENLGGLSADVANSEGGDEAPERLGFAFFDGVDDIGGAFFSHSFKSDQIAGGEFVEVGEIFYEGGVDELFDERLAEVFYVHLSPAGEVFEAFL